MFARHALLLFLLWGVLSGRAAATAQIPEEIVIDGKSQILFSEPLNQYLLQRGKLALLEPHLSKERCSGSWRNYQGTWEIRNARLYLTRLQTDPCSDTPKEIPLSSLFVAATGPVFANWYTGTLLVPVGKQLRYVHMGYESEYERYIVFNVSAGKVTRRHESSTRPK